MPYIPYLPYIPNIPYFPNMPYQTDHTHHTYPPYHTTPPPHHRGGRGTVPHPHHTTGGGGGRSHMGPVYGTHPPHHRGGRGTVPHPHHTTGGGGGRSHMGPVYGTHPPHHRGGRGTVPHPHHTTGGEGEDLIWDQYMGPIPNGGGGRGGVAGPGAYIHIHLPVLVGFPLWDGWQETIYHPSILAHMLFQYVLIPMVSWALVQVAAMTLVPWTLQRPDVIAAAPSALTAHSAQSVHKAICSHRLPLHCRILRVVIMNWLEYPENRC